MFYVLDDKGNKVEGYDKEGFLAVLQQAIDNGDLDSIDADNAFVTKLKCCVGGGTFKVAFVTQAQYNTLRDGGQLLTGALYFITDDETEVNLETLIAQLRTDVDGLEATIDDILDGTTTVKKSEKDRNGNTIDQTYKTNKRLMYSGDFDVKNDGGIIFVAPCTKPYVEIEYSHRDCYYCQKFRVSDNLSEPVCTLHIFEGNSNNTIKFITLVPSETDYLISSENITETVYIHKISGLDE